MVLREKCRFGLGGFVSLEVKVRRACVGDAAIITQFNIDHALEIEDMALDAEKVSQGVNAVFLDASKGCYFVAEIDGEVVGSLLITYEWSDWRAAQIWWLQSVFVKPNARNHGAFKALFEFIEYEAKANSACELKLYVMDNNPRAKAAYERVGMHQSRYVIFEKEIVDG